MLARVRATVGHHHHHLGCAVLVEVRGPQECRWHVTESPALLCHQIVVPRLPRQRQQPVQDALAPRSDYVLRRTVAIEVHVEPGARRQTSHYLWRSTDLIERDPELVQLCDPAAGS